MAEETVVIETSQQPVVEANPFGAWSENIPEQQKQTEGQDGGQQQAAASTEQAAATVTTEQPKVEIPVEWLKNEFGVEDPALIKAEREELKKLKETPATAAEIKFENEQSKQLHELYRTGKWNEANKIIQTQNRITELIGLGVNESTAADIIKMGMQLKYKEQELDPTEIEYKFNKEYGFPKEPQPKDDDLEGEFEARQAAWKDQVEDIKMNRNIEAKLAKSELEKAKVNLVLPEIDKPTAQANEPTAEQQEQAKKVRENFLSKLESDYAKAEGFKTKVVDESVKLEFPVEFKIPDEAKVAIKTMLTEGLDVNAYMDKRWFDEKGTPKVEQIMSDLYQLENLDKILSGVANNAANERIKEYRKQTSNVSLNGTTHQETFNPNQNGNANASPFSNDAWSEKPPIFQN